MTVSYSANICVAARLASIKRLIWQTHLAH